MKIQNSVYHGLTGLFEIFLGGRSLSFRKRLVGCFMGIFAETSIVPRRIAAGMEVTLSRSVCLESHERSIRRLLSDPRLNFKDVYLPFLKKVLSIQRKERVFLAIDETARKGDFRVLVAALCCAGRAVPIAWVSWRAQIKAKVSYWSHLKKLFAQVNRILRKDVEVIVLGDRAFGNTHFTDLVEKYHWNWLVRLQKQTCFQFSQGHSKQIFCFFTQPDRFKSKGKLFKKAGWREASLVCWWESSYKEALLLGSNLPPSWDLVEYYQKRCLIECMFRDWKSKGWDWEECHLHDFHRHNRLILLMCMATVLVLVLGQQEAKELLSKPKRKQKTLPSEAKRSLFQLGLKRLRACLFQTRKLPQEWTLGGWNEPNWIEQICQHHLSPVLIAKG